MMPTAATPDDLWHEGLFDRQAMSWWGGLVTSTIFTLLVLPTFYGLVRAWQDRLRLKQSTAPEVALG